MKTDRSIFFDGEKIKIVELVREALRRSWYKLVKINGREYFAYRFESSLTGVPKASVIVCLPKKGGFDGDHPNVKAAHIFISTNACLPMTTILETYVNRWSIETFFQQMKGRLGFGRRQIRSEDGIKRFWLIMSLFHLLCCAGLGGYKTFGEGMDLLREECRRINIDIICQSALNNAPRERIYKLAA
jgi:hypothetical protein